MFTALGPVRRAAQVVHGDLTGNVHLGPSGPPVVLDLTPYWRPVGYAAAVVVVDHLLAPEDEGQRDRHGALAEHAVSRATVS